MNFLDICQRVRQEAGIQGTGPSAVTSQTGMNKKIVDWVNAAWNEIQEDNKGSRWMVGSFTLPISDTDGADYSAADASITDLEYWIWPSFRVYTNSIGATDETPISYVPYEQFRAQFDWGSAAQTATKPGFVTTLPDHRIRFSATPDQAYTVRGDYRKSATDMDANDSAPGNLPSQYHMMIVWRAVQFYAQYDQDDHLAMSAATNFARVENRLNGNPDLTIPMGFGKVVL